MINAELKLDWGSVSYTKSLAVKSVLDSLDGCGLWFNGVEFKGRHMIVQVSYQESKLDAPRHEGEAEELVQRELDKAGLSAGILIVSGTEYVDETLRV